MNFLEIKNLYKKYQLPITLIIGTLLFFVSTFWQPAIYIASVFILLSYIFSSIEDIFAYSFYFMLFSGVIIFYVVIAVGTFLVVFIKYIVDVINEKAEVHKKPLIATTVLVIIYSIIHYKLNEYGIFQGLLIIALFYLSYVMFCYRKQISIRKLFKVMCMGIISTSILSLVLYFCSSAEVFVFDNFDYTFKTVKEKVLLNVAGQYNRLELFSYHPNHLASFCMFLIAYAIYSFINYNYSKKNLIENITMLSVGLIIGILTLSKSFFIIFALEIAYTFIFLIVHYKKQSLKFMIPIMVSLLIGILIFHKQIFLILTRLFPNGANTSFNDITTGRAAIWGKFINELLTSPVKLIFGEGIFTTDIVDIGPHSLYVAILFRFGIIGTIAICGLIFTYIKSINLNFKINIKKVLPILIFLIYSIQETNIDERFLFLIIAIMLLFNITEKDDLTKIKTSKPKKKEKIYVELDINNKNLDTNTEESSKSENLNSNEDLENNDSENSLVESQDT